MNHKSTHRLLIAAVGMACSGMVSGLARADLFVIAHPATQIAAGDIRDVFTGEKQFAGPTRLIPVDNGPAQEAFLSAALKMEAARYSTTWTKKSFREGLTPPSVKSGDNDVLDFVRRTPGAVGYVRIQPTGVTVVQKF